MTSLTKIDTTSPFDSIRRTDGNGEFWSARELMPLLGYTSWRRFEEAIPKAHFGEAGTDRRDTPQPRRQNWKE